MHQQDVDEEYPINEADFDAMDEEEAMFQQESGNSTAAASAAATISAATAAAATTATQNTSTSSTRPVPKKGTPATEVPAAKDSTNEGIEALKEEKEALPELKKTRMDSFFTKVRKGFSLLIQTEIYHYHFHFHFQSLH
jgi:hypothetical protein